MPEQSKKSVTKDEVAAALEQPSAPEASAEGNATTASDTTEDGGARTKAVRLSHGTYVGPGCPNPSKRKRAEDKGFGYDHDHPARDGEVIVHDGEDGHKHAARMIKSGVATAA